jgi:hypothetical protein
VTERWLAAMPRFVPAHEAMITVLDTAGDSEQSEAVARAIIELEPGHAQAELRVIDRLLQRDPEAALARVESLLARAEDPVVKRSLRQLLGRGYDIAGQPDVAVATWAELHSEVVSQRLPLPQPTAPIAQFPPLAPLPDPAPGVLLLWGAPGSLVERIALTFELAGGPLRAERYGANPPDDPLQRYDTPQALVDGTLDGAEMVARWRAALPGRGIQDGNVFDWLLLWDNALLLALRPHLPEGLLLVAVRDPRDMLLEWLAFDAPQRFAFGSPEVAARWLADSLAQVADLHEGDLFPHRLLKLDDIAYDAPALAAAVGEALAINLLPLPSLGIPHFAPGHWRAYAQPLAAAFAALTPVAVRLGYPEN